MRLFNPSVPEPHPSLSDSEEEILGLCILGEGVHPTLGQDPNQGPELVMRLLNIILSVFVLFSGNVIMYVPLHVIIITIIICDKILLQLNFLNMIK